MIYNPYPTVELPFGKDNRYFLDLFDSIIQVDRKYVSYKVEFSKNRYGYVKHLERVFAYEFYRHWSNKVHQGNTSLVLNAEINKVINVNKISCDVLTNTENESPKTEELTLYPDIVLHHSQSDDTAQILTCEIKRDKNLTGSLILGDIYKICCYMTEEKFKDGKNPFKYGVFIVVGDKKLSDIIGMLKDDTKIKCDDGSDILYSNFIKCEEFSSSFGRIVCVAYDGITLEYKTFYDMIKD